MARFGSGLGSGFGVGLDLLPYLDPTRKCFIARYNEQPVPRKILPDTPSIALEADAAINRDWFNMVCIYNTWFLPKTGIPGHFCANNRYILKPSVNHTPGALRLASLTSYLFLA